jgi:hypothetical protein
LPGQSELQTGLSPRGKVSGHCASLSPTEIRNKTEGGMVFPKFEIV